MIRSAMIFSWNSKLEKMAKFLWTLIAYDSQGQVELTKKTSPLSTLCLEEALLLNHKVDNSLIDSTSQSSKF